MRVILVSSSYSQIIPVLQSRLMNWNIGMSPKSWWDEEYGTVNLIMDKVKSNIHTITSISVLWKLSSSNPEINANSLPLSIFPIQFIKNHTNGYCQLRGGYMRHLPRIRLFPLCWSSVFNYQSLGDPAALNDEIYNRLVRFIQVNYLKLFHMVRRIYLSSLRIPTVTVIFIKPITFMGRIFIKQTLVPL